MSTMSRIEAAFCRSAPWRGFASRVVVPWALAGRRLHGDCLEVGAGSGAMAERLLDQAPDIRLTVLDVDPDMTSAAQRRLRRFGERAVTATGDATSLPYPDRSFDYVLSWLMLHHTIEWEDCLAEARRVLRPNGLLIGYDLLDTAPARLIHRLDRSEHCLFNRDELEQALAREFDGSQEVRVAMSGLVGRFVATPAASGVDI